MNIWDYLSLSCDSKSSSVRCLNESQWTLLWCLLRGVLSRLLMVARTVPVNRFFYFGQSKRMRPEATSNRYNNITKYWKQFHFPKIPSSITTMSTSDQSKMSLRLYLASFRIPPPLEVQCTIRWLYPCQLTAIAKQQLKKMLYPMSHRTEEDAVAVEFPLFHQTLPQWLFPKAGDGTHHLLLHPWGICLCSFARTDVGFS